MRASCLLVAGLVVLALGGCSKPAGTPADAGGDSSPAKSSTAGSPAAAADTAPSSLCIDRGKAASQYAQERDKGTGLDQVIIEIEKTTLPEEEKTARKDVARQLYHDPFASKLSPDNATNNFQGACMTEVAKTTSGVQNISGASEIEKALVLFKTYSGQSLTDLFASIGVSIQSVQVAPSNGSGSYHAGDVIYTLTLAPGAHADAPCRLQKWVTGDITPSPEFVRRGPAFPLLRPEEDDPLIYWAATGNCSTAFNN